jgi:Protein of unknown function (DUF3800)
VTDQSRVKKYYAYIDESGTHANSPHESVALALIPAGAKDDFEKSWSNLLSKQQCRVFHMTDFNGAQREFRGWSNARTHEFSMELIKVIRNYVEFWIGHVFETESRVLVEDESVALSLYMVGCGFLLRSVEDWVNAQRGSVEVIYVFEQGVRDQRKFDEAISATFSFDADTTRRFRYGRHSYETKSVPGLQVADVFAWQLTRDARQYDAHKSRRGDFKALLEIPHLIGHFDGVALNMVRQGLLS